MTTPTQAQALDSLLAFLDEAIKLYRKHRSADINATIECCAQVADKFSDRSSTAVAIAEDIRKLKDEQ